MHVLDMPSATRRAGAALVGLAFAAGLAGCGGPAGERAIARVGHQTVTVADYNDAAPEGMLRYPGSPDSAKARLIDDLVNQKLLLEYGFQSGILADSMAKLDYLHMEDQMLRAAILGRLIPSAVPVSDAEVLRFWQRRDSSSRAQIIYALSPELIRAAHAAVVGGADFGSVANRYNVTGGLPPEGDLGYMTVGSLAEPLDRLLRDTPPGEVVGPVRAPGEGWFLLKVVDRKASERDSFHVESSQLAQALRQRKRRLLAARAFEALRDQYRVTIEPDGVHALYGYFNVPGSTGMPDPNPTPEKLAQILARFDGGGGHAGTYTLADALQDLESVEGERPNPYMQSSFGPWLEARVVERFLLVEARRRRLQDDPALKRELDRRFLGELMNSVFTTAIVQPTRADEDDLRAAYERSRAVGDPPFEALDEARRQMLAYDADDIARMRRFTQLSDSLRAAIPVSIDAAAVKRLAWPVGG